MYKAPGIFAGIWAIVKPFIDPDTAGKIVFTNDLIKELTCHHTPVEASKARACCQIATGRD